MTAESVGETPGQTITVDASNRVLLIDKKVTIEPPGQPLTVDASKDRIAKAGNRWFQVLDVPRTTPLDDLKKVYRKLCLLHHPDKNGGDADTFKTIQKAYEEGIKASAVRNIKAKKGKGKGKGKKNKPKAKRKAKSGTQKRKSENDADMEAGQEGTAQSQAESEATQGSIPKPQKREPSPPRPKKKARPKPLPANASKAKLSSTIEKWDVGVKGKTMPDEVPSVTADQAAEWLREGSCIPIDVRPSHESSNESKVPGAVALTYFQFLTAPEDVAPEVARLRDTGKRLIIFSQNGPTMGPCGLLGSLLLDIFGLDEEIVYRLEGGYDQLRPLLDVGGGDGNTLECALNARKELQMAREAQKHADTVLAKARAELAVYDAASRDHLEVLSKGSWDSEDAAKEHLSQLSPLLKPLQLESSLVAMLQNAVIKRPAQRGPFDTMVFNELTSRFSKKVESLRSDVAAAATEVSEKASAVQAAQAAVDKTAAHSCPGE